MLVKLEEISYTEVINNSSLKTQFRPLICLNCQLEVVVTERLS